MFNVSELFKKNYNSRKKVVVNQGGTGSGKTYSILQVLYLIAIKEPYSVITVAGSDIPNLKKGAIRDALTILSNNRWLNDFVTDYNKTDRIIFFKNGSIIEFNSYDDEQDAKSGKRTHLFVNEANGVTYEVYWQLAIRTKNRIFVDYNPSAAFWCHHKLIGNTEVQMFISDHRHNPFLSKEQHEEIEGIQDKELWRVYARGLTGKIHGLIYPNFQIIDEMPGIYKSVYGLDFGFNHKTALIEVAKDANRLFWNELIYQSEVTIGDLIQIMKELDLGRKPIYCDHAAADKIEDLKRAGFNALKADKDVINGIDFVKRSKLYITKSSTGLRKEIMSYKWKVDKNGVTLDEPVKFNDDACDAARYGAYSHFRKNKGFTIGNAAAPSPLDWIK